MKNKFKKNTLGFTLVELILALALVSFVIVLSANLIIAGSRAQKFTFKEYSLQSDIRRATEMVNEVVRYSKAVFAVPETFVETDDVMDPGWNYLMISRDGKRIVRMEYDEDADKHMENVIVEESEGILYAVDFEKNTEANSDRVLNYRIYAYNTDDEGNKINEKLLYETTVETVNAIQVVDKGSVSSPSIALAFRDDGQTSGKGKNQIAYITVVVDVSASMNQSPSNQGSTSSEHDNARIKNVRRALAGTTDNRESGIIQRFSKEENVFLSLVTFSTTGNYPTPSANLKPNTRYPIYDVYNNLIHSDPGDNPDGLVNTVDALKAAGGTNTGDGLRQAYHLHDQFRDRMNIDEKDQVHHYTILLVDGVSTYETRLRQWEDKGGYERKSYIEWIWIFPVTRYYNAWVPNGHLYSNEFYLNEGNIDVVMQDNPSSPYEAIRVSNPQEGRSYGEKFENRDLIEIAGDGRSTTSNLNKIKNYYVDAVGQYIKGYDGGSGIKSYIIGYASDLNTHINGIGTSIGTDPQYIYSYDDPGFNLDEIFQNIASDIMADFWLAAGPQIMK